VAAVVRMTQVPERTAAIAAVDRLVRGCST
jgi:hypothetical protein